jgi:hypothetical protein
MTKSFTLKDLLMYESEHKQETKQIESDKINISPSSESVSFVLAYAQALCLINNRITGPLCILLN